MNGTIDSVFQDFINKCSVCFPGATCCSFCGCDMQSDTCLHCLTVFVLACFIGYYVVWKVTPALHAPLMSVTNAISSVVIVGAILAAAQHVFQISRWCGFIAIVLASINIFGGFTVTYRMLSMFQKK